MQKATSADGYLQQERRSPAHCSQAPLLGNCWTVPEGDPPALTRVSVREQGSLDLFGIQVV